MRFHPFAAAALAVAMSASLGVAPSSADSMAGMSMAAQPNTQSKSWTVGDLTISGAYARATLPNAPVGGGFIAITNKGAADDTLVSATSPMAGLVQIHTMSMANGVMQMRELPQGVPVPAGKTVTFSPNGLHLMFMQLKGAFVQGKTVPVTLNFAKAGPVTVDLDVGGIAASAPPGAGAAGGAMSGMKM